MLRCLDGDLTIHKWNELIPRLAMRYDGFLYVEIVDRIQSEVHATGSTFGTYFRVTTYGESHGGGVGCIIDGCPPRLSLSEADMQLELDRSPSLETQRRPLPVTRVVEASYVAFRNIGGANESKEKRRPGQSRITSARKETDTCQIYSGIAEGVTTGSPIMVNVPNTNQRGHDYSEMSMAYRPSHADATYDFKYGVRSVQGGGRSSARETIGRVAAGAVAKKILKKFSGTEVLAYVSQVHKVVLPESVADHESLTLEQIQELVRAPQGTQELVVAPEKTQELKVAPLGTQELLVEAPQRTRELVRKQHTVTRDKQATKLIVRGRHEHCVVPRAVPIVEAMVALVLVDQLMAQYAQCELFPINPALQEPMELPMLDPARLPI
ncbi:hypothetical protein HHK36_018924 [Tetracentron sinense]|uniref:chorismate synthase n=1 Tax=Tetracentron sinense TaxID=13715 RepID=A0A834YVC9_TETSI|nr:hypothetical protein HHK36_018924 [Tetracentron sinense]